MMINEIIDELKVRLIEAEDNVKWHRNRLNESDRKVESYKQSIDILEEWSKNEGKEPT